MPQVDTSLFTSVTLWNWVFISSFYLVFVISVIFPLLVNIKCSVNFYSKATQMHNILYTVVDVE